MPFKKALLVACLLLLPGVLLRVTPYVDRIAGAARSSDGPAPGAGEERVRPGALNSIPSRLSQRPIALIALGFAVEVGLYAILIVTLLRSRRLMRLFDPIAPVAKVAGLGFLAILFAGFLGGTEGTFPIGPWRMYSGQPDGTPDVCLLDGRTSSGARVRFTVAEVLPMMRRHRAYAMVCDRVGEAVRAGVAGREGSEVAAALLATARLYNLQHPADPLEQLSASFGVVPIDNASLPWVRDLRVVETVEVE